LKDTGSKLGSAVSQDGADGDSFDAVLREVAHASEPCALQASLQLPSGSTVAQGRLSIVRPIGQGGMGVVYQAFDSERNAPVALKTLSRMDASGVYRLKHEFRALADVRHRNLVRLYDLFADGERWFFTMELIRGEPFDRWVRPHAGSHAHNVGGEQLDEARLRMVLPQLLAGIEAVHSAGKLHRDLKPSNVLVTPGGRAVLLDFSLAADLHAGGVGQTLHDNAVSGTPAYMAPEQAAGDAASTASDLYAVGVMLFEALTGRLPFVGRSHDVLVDKQRSAAPAVLSYCPQAPPDLAACCDALLQRDSATRPSCSALKADFGVIIEQSSAVASAQPEPLVGRDRELAVLSDAYQQTARMEQAVVLFLSGESGMGKSALVGHCLEQLRADGHAVVLAGRCYERESVPFKGFDGLVDELSRFLRKLSHAQAGALLPRDAHTLARTFPVLGRIEAVAHAPKRPVAAPEELRQRAFDAFAELLARVRDRQPLVVHIDDAQWLDRDGVALLEFLLAQHAPVPMLLVLAHRSEDAARDSLLVRIEERARENPSWRHVELALGPLSEDATHVLARRLLGSDDCAPCAQLANQSLGSPFLLGELVQSWRSAAGGELSLHDALRAHVRACSAGAQRVVEVLAVAARPLAAKIALAAAEANHAQLDELHEARLLASRGTGEGRALECYHDKIRESVRQALPAEQACVLHARLLAALLAHGDGDAEHLAVHAEGAGERALAAHYSALAGDAASEATAFERAAMLYQRALELGEHDDRARGALLTRLGDALASAGHGADAARALLESARGLPEHAAFELKRRAAEQLLICGRIDAGKALLDEVLRSVGTRLPATPKRALIMLGWERLRLGLRGRSFRQRTEPLSASQQRELDTLAIAICLTGIDVFASAAFSARYARRALDSGSPRYVAYGLGLLAYALATHRGEAVTNDVAALFARAEALALASEEHDAFATISFLKGSAMQAMGAEPAVAAEQCERAIELLGETPNAWLMRSAARSICNTSGEIYGRFVSVAELAAQVDAAFRRGDLFSATTLLNSGAVSRLLQGDTQGLTSQLARARREWIRPKVYSFVDFELLMTEVVLANHANQPLRALEHLLADSPAIERSKLLAIPGLSYELRARRALAAFLSTESDPADAAPLRALLRRDVLAIAPLRLPSVEGPRLSLLSMLELREQRTESAIAHLRAAIVASERIGWLTHAATARLRLGSLLGDAEGAALIAHGEAALRAMGVTDIEAAVRIV
jgi:hypothetical protein